MPEFFHDLAEHNDRGWWRANADRYERDVARPVEDLIDALQPEFGPIRRFPPTATSGSRPTSGPIRSMPAPPRSARAGTLYAQFGACEVVIAGGRWRPSSAELSRFRQLVDNPRTAEDVERQLAERSRDGLLPDDEAVLKTAPRGYPRDHPRLELLRRTRLSLAARLEAGPWLTTAEALSVLTRLWRSADRWNGWLRENVPPETDHGGRRRNRD